MRVTAVAPDTVGVKIGDYFYASWGYDQTNVDWFRVVGLTPKGVKIQKVFGKTVTDDGPYTTVVPTPEPYTIETRIYDDEGRVTWDDQGQIATEVTIAPIVTKRLQSYGDEYGRPYLPWKSYAHLYKWDGTPKYQTGSGWGH
jgi:hypothetical protein